MCKSLIETLAIIATLCVLGNWLDKDIPFMIAVAALYRANSHTNFKTGEPK